MRKPRALRKGDTLGLVAPSGSLRDSAQAARARAMLEGLGFRVRAGASCCEVYGYLAGSDRSRAADLDAFFADPGIDGIVCLKGGYGAPRILDLVDWEAVARNPKVFVGYSDITALHLALDRLRAMPSFHGPMGVSDALLDAEPFSTAAWLAALSSTKPLGRLDSPPGFPAPSRVTKGKARGRLVGGNLSLIAASMGTPWQVDARGAILFIEDIGEAPYRIDRMLNQLRLGGVFADCAGIVFGDWNNCSDEAGKASLTIDEVVRDIVSPSGRPAIRGFRAGHCSPTHTLPFGVEALLDADDPSLSILEAAAV